MKKSKMTVLVAAVLTLAGASGGRAFGASFESLKASLAEPPCGPGCGVPGAPGLQTSLPDAKGGPAASPSVAGAQEAPKKVQEGDTYGKWTYQEAKQAMKKVGALDLKLLPGKWLWVGEAEQYVGYWSGYSPDGWYSPNGLKGNDLKGKGYVRFTAADAPNPFRELQKVVQMRFENMFVNDTGGGPMDCQYNEKVASSDYSNSYFESEFGWEGKYSTLCGLLDKDHLICSFHSDVEGYTPHFGWERAIRDGFLAFAREQE